MIWSFGLIRREVSVCGEITGINEIFTSLQWDLSEEETFYYCHGAACYLIRNRCSVNFYFWIKWDGSEVGKLFHSKWKGPIVNMLGFVFCMVSVATSQDFCCSAKANECGCVLMKLFSNTSSRTDLAVGFTLPSPHMDADVDRWYHLSNAYSGLGTVQYFQA